MIRVAALALTVLTGFSGLVYEVTWQKYLATMLGSHSEATAAVLAIFLGGLSAGYALFGRLSRQRVDRARDTGRPLRLLRFYALVEGGIGIYAFLLPTLFSVAQSASLLAPVGYTGLGFAFDVLLSALLIGPPSVLMGGTVPILTLALVGDIERATKVHAWVYGFNTVGAFAGALACGFVLIPLLGLDGVLYTMGFVNLFAAGSFLLLDRIGSNVAPDLEATVSSVTVSPGTDPPVTDSPQKVERFTGFATVGLLAGFAMMTVQTIANRIGALAFGSSEFTFAMIVAVFVLSIALGSLVVSALPRIPASLIVSSQWAQVAVLFLLYRAVPDATYWAYLIRSNFRQVDTAFYPFYHLAFIGVFLVCVVPVGLSGMLLPLLFHQLRREVGDLGSVAGRLYSWNTLGSLLGALLGGYLLLFWLDLHHVYRIALAGLVVSATILTVLVFRIPRLLAALLVVAPALAALATLPDWSPSRLSAGLFRQREPGPLTASGPDALFAGQKVNILFHRDGPTSTVAVREGSYRGVPSRGIITNGKPDGNLIGDYPTMALLALIPALIVEEPERNFVIGFGTGVTAGELAALEGTREVQVAEISQAVLEAAPLFDMGNLNASKNPKISIVRGDAYRTLLRSDGRFDVIVSEPSNPWVTGVEMLYSVEFLEAARGRLAPGGVYAQWFHLYEIDSETVDLVLRTYASVFPHVSVWYTMGADLLLLGFDGPMSELDLEAMEARFRRRDFSAGFERVEIESFAALLSHELIPVGVLHAASLEGALHTLRKPILSHRAARAFFRGHIAQLPKFLKPPSPEVGMRNSLLRRYAGVEEGLWPESILEDATRETCGRNRPVDCATLLARWKRDHPDSTRRLAAFKEIRTGIPATVTERKLAPLVTLFGGRGIAELPGKSPLERASKASISFFGHYHHAMPFDPRVLNRAWRRCAAVRCEAPRRKVQARLGRNQGWEELNRELLGLLAEPSDEVPANVLSGATRPQ